MKSRPIQRDHKPKQMRLASRLSEKPVEASTDKPVVEDLPQGKDAAQEAAKAKDD